MPAQEGPESGRGDDVNVVRLVGRLSAPPEEVVLPSGDTTGAQRDCAPSRTPGSAARELTPSFGKTRYRCAPTVRCDR